MWAVCVGAGVVVQCGIGGKVCRSVHSAECVCDGWGECEEAGPSAGAGVLGWDGRSEWEERLVAEAGKPGPWRVCDDGIRGKEAGWWMGSEVAVREGVWVCVCVVMEGGGVCCRGAAASV